MGFLITVVLPLALAFIMFSLGLGLTLDDFKRVLVRPLAFFTGAVSQIILVPLIAYVLLMVFSLPPELAVGFMILSFCPGGVTSNIISKLANGDVALSVSLTAIVSLLTMITVPLLVAWSVLHFMGDNAPEVNISSLAISMFLITTLPVLLGVMLRHYAKAFADKVENMVSKIAVGLFVTVIVGAIASNWNVVTSNISELGLGLVALVAALSFVGFAVSRILGASKNEAKTISVETGVQNGALALAIAGLLVAGGPTFNAYAIPAALYSVVWLTTALPAFLFVGLSRGSS